MTNELPDVEAGLLAATIEAPNSAPVPKVNQTTHCLSCGAATPQAYCGECGLKNDDLRRSLPKLIMETLGGIFSFEGRMWRTWAALLFKPGKVAREYADGKRTTYSAPIRVYLVMTFLLLFYLAATQTNLVAVAVSEKTPEQKAAALIMAQEAETKVRDSIEAMEMAKEEIAQEFIDGATGNEPPSKATNETTDEKEGGTISGVIGTTEVKFKPGDYNFKFLFFQPQSKFEEIMDTASAEQFAKTMNEQEDSKATGLNGETFDVTKAATTFLTNPTRFNQQFNYWLPKAMFFMVPMVMFFGVIYIRGPNALLYDHLIHAIYIHSVFFMALLFAILMSKVISGATIARILFIGFLFYLPLSLKRMFGRGWFKTIWTTFNIGFIYLLMLTIVMSLITAYSMQQLAT